MAEEKSKATKKDAKQVVSLDSIKFNKDNAVLAALSCIPIVGAVVFFVEKKDMFVRYYAAQYGLLFVLDVVLGLVTPVLMVIPVINVIVGFVSLCVAPLLSLAVFIAVIMGAIKAYKGERFDVPMVSEWALKAMNQW